MMTVADFDKLLRSWWKERGHAIPPDQRMGIAVSELIANSAERNIKVETPYLDLWISMFDEFVSWQISLLTVFYGSRKDTRRQLKDFDKAVTTLLMKIVADSLAMRHLILLGFDTAARTILRSTSEYMELYVAILHDPNLATEFVRTDTPHQARKFWETRLASGAIRKTIFAAWRNFFRSDHDNDAASWFSSWGNNSYDKLSAMSHPSYAAGVFTAIPFKTKFDDENWLGVWGDKSEGSTDTIFIYSHFMFPMLLLYREFPFEKFGSHMTGGKIKYKSSNELHKHIRVGRDVLASLILSLGTHTNLPHVFPDYDMSVWSANDRQKKERFGSTTPRELGSEWSKGADIRR